MPMTTTARILASSSQYDLLQHQKAQYRTVPPAQAEAQQQLTQLLHRRARSAVQLKQLGRDVEKQRAEHLAAQSRSKGTARWWGKRERSPETASGRATKEEEVYVKSMEEEQLERGKHEKLMTEVAEARAKVDYWNTEVDKLKDLRQQEDALFEVMFSGGDVDFPEVSVLEDRLLPARVAYEHATQELENAEKALASLGSAKTCLSQCEKEMEESRVWGGWDVYGGGLGADFQECSPLILAEQLATEGRHHASNAHSLDGNIPELLVIDIPDQPVGFSVAYTASITGETMSGRLKQGLQSVQEARNHLDRTFTEHDDRVRRLTQTVANAEANLEAVRRELRRARRTIVREVIRKSRVPGGVIASQGLRAESSPMNGMQDDVPPPYAHVQVDSPPAIHMSA